MAAAALSHLHLHLHLHLHGILSSSKLSLSRSNPIRPSRPPIIAATVTRDQSYWAAIDTTIEAHLKKSITIRPPVSVFEPMHHLTFAAPKSKAPPLCMAACELVGGSADDAITAASVLHLMHAAAFTHQHLPLTDRPAASRPTGHHSYSPNIELLIPDGIVPFGFMLLGQSELARKDPDRILRVIIEISRAVGSEGMVDGLYRELLYSRSEGEEDMVENICEKKEGELHACAGACGALLGKGSEEEIEKLRKFGLYVGMIQGMLYGVGKDKEGRFEIVEKLRGLALKEMEIFSVEKVEKISTLLEIYSLNW